MNQTNSAETKSCQIHGPYTIEPVQIFGNTFWPKCPVCIEQENQRIAENEKLRQEQDAAARWSAKLGKAGIPPRFTNRSLETFIPETEGQRQALNFALQYAFELVDGSAQGRGALFVGQAGTGKTHLAVGIGLKLLEARFSVHFTTVFRMIRRIKDTWLRRAEETESGVVELMTKPDLLILDEVGTQYGSETEKIMLFDVLNERYEERKSTILLSNLTIDRIQDYLGDRILDRMREDGGEIIPFSWQSYRKQKGQP